MQSKTPQFDALLQPILEALVPHTRECAWKDKHPYCEKEFSIEEEDIEFLRMFKVPAPHFCPTCRRIRRLPHMGMVQLFKRKCDVPEHDETMISLFSEECPFPVYDYKYFIGDEFDPMTFGVPYNPQSDHLDTLWKLRKSFPMPSFLNKDVASINSEYSNGGRDTKNAYYCSGCFSCEDMWYTNFANKSKAVMDSRTIRDSDHVYGSLQSDHLYQCSFVYFSSNCTESMLLFDCRNCTDCFGCVNLRNKKYCVFNEQYTKEEYESFIRNLYPLRRSALEKYEVKFWKFVKELPMNASHNVGSENVSGVGIVNSKDLFDVIDAVKAQNVRHADSPLTHHDSIDFLFSGGSHHIYGTINIGSQSSWVKFSVSSKFCTDSEYIFNSKNLSNCFMCFGLQNKSYCILNRQYEKEEYFRIVDEIKSHLVLRGEYGDGLGIEYCAQGYNTSLAQISYPLDDETIHAIGGYVTVDPEINLEGIEVLSKEEVPETIEEVDDGIVVKAILCNETKRPFKIIPSELAFYRKMRLPLPTVHPQVRMIEMMRMVPTARMYSTDCAKCQKKIHSIFNPEERYNLYCETCYQSEIL
ncbi:MAG: hypothetical protein KBB88_01420 [Candidatus Pacebacteria bacterium]|nr:hypothetical protein [Candidatus Paceibacterota bacterium]